MSTKQPETFERILFCTDFSQNAYDAFGFAVDAASRRPGCLLYILHVIPEPDAQFWKTYIYEVEDIDKKAKQDIDVARQNGAGHAELEEICGRALERAKRFRVDPDYPGLVEQIEAAVRPQQDADGEEGR